MSSNFILQLYRGSAAQNDAYTGKAGELTIDTSHRRIRIHDGTTQGGHPLASLSEILNPTQIQDLVDSEVAELESSVLSQLTGKASLSGSSLQDFNTDTLYVRKILPLESAVDIGDETNRFRAIYVDEAYLSTNTLYIGDTPIMGTDQDTVIIRTDPNQSMSLITSGSGSLNVQSQRNVTVSTDGMNADVHLNAYGAGSNVRLGAKEDIVFTAENIRANASLDVRGDLDIRDDLVVGGNLSVKGQTFEVDTERVRATDNMMVLNYGEEGSGVTAQYAGIEIDRGNMSSYQFVFDEIDDLFKVGMVGDLEAVATRDWVGGLYSEKGHEHYSATTTVSGFMSAEDKVKLNGISSGATPDQSKADIDALGINAATVNGRSVESNVPSNAQFTDTVYDDSSVLTTLSDLENGKVDKVTGKGLSANDFTNTLKSKLDGIESGAQKNVGTDLSVGGSGDDRTLVSSTGSNANLPLASSDSAGLMSSGDKSKLAGIDAGAEVNSVNSVAGKTGDVSLVKGDVGLSDVDNYGRDHYDGRYSRKDSYPTLEYQDEIPPLESGFYGIIHDSEIFHGNNSQGAAIVMRSNNDRVIGFMGATGSGTTTKLGAFTYDSSRGFHTHELYHSGNSEAFDSNAHYGGLRAGGTTASDVGLGDVDNTPDADKPISTAQQAALDAKVDIGDIIDSLTNNASDKPLSAAQGRVLKIHIDNINAVLQSDDSDLDELQEIVDYIKANRSDLENLSISNIAGLENALNGKVDVVSGKGLSTNDYTNTEKSKLSGIEVGAEVNTVTSVAGKTGNISLSAGDVGGLSDAATTSVSTIRSGTTKANVGLSNVRNVSSYSQSEVDDAFVAKSGNQTVNGNKVFRDDVSIDRLFLTDMGSNASRVGLILERGSQQYGVHLSRSLLHIEPYGKQGDGLVMDQDGNVDFGGTISGNGSGLTGNAPLRATGTTKSDVGLSDVRNVSSYSQTESDDRYISLTEDQIIGGEKEFNETIKFHGRGAFGDQLNHPNIDNALNPSVNTGVSAFRPLNFIDSSGVMKISRVDEHNGAGIELTQWDEDIEELVSWADLSAERNVLKLRNLQGETISFETNEGVVVKIEDGDLKLKGGLKGHFDMGTL